MAYCGIYQQLCVGQQVVGPSDVVSRNGPPINTPRLTKIKVGTRTDYHGACDSHLPHRRDYQTRQNSPSNEEGLRRFRL